MRPSAALFVAVLAGCSSIKEAVNPRSIAQLSPEPATPLAAPSESVEGGKGDADAPYPADFAVTVKNDGTILFPERTVARIRGSSIVVNGQPVITVSDDGRVAGVGLKHRYRFDADGQLVDDTGHGVAMSPDGAVHGIGGEWHFRSVFVWTTEGGGAWNKSAWHTLEIVALVMLERMMPRALRPEPDAGAQASGGKPGHDDKGVDIHIPPPSEWFK